MDDQKDAQELLFIGMAGLGLVALKQVWTERLRPWVESTWGEIRAGAVIDLPGGGTLDQADLIGVAVLAIPFLVGLAVAASVLRRRRRSARRALPREKAPRATVDD